MAADLRATWASADFPETIRRIDRHFGSASYSLRSLFKDEQRRILNEILASTREDLETRFKLVVERYGPLMKFLQSAGAPLPPGLDTASDFVLHSDIRREIQAPIINFDLLRNLIREAESRGTRVLDPDISYVIKNRMEQMMNDLTAQSGDLALMQVLQQLAELVMPLPLGLNLWKVQNTYWEMLQRVLPQYRDRAVGGDPSAAEWIKQFLQLGRQLSFAVDPSQVPAPAELPMAA
jgi:hypothetical protein